MKNPFLLSITVLGLLCLSGLADVVTLKSGEKIEGKITAETATAVTIDAKVSAGIVDTRTVPKADIAKVEKEQPDEIAWQKIKDLKLSANSLPSASYDPTLGMLRAFTTQYPNSPHVADAQKLLDSFEAEKKRVEGGEVKLNDKWLTKEEAEKERYQINGLIAFNYMKDQSTRRDLIGALNSFEIIEKQYPGARVYPDAVELARGIQANLKADVDRRLQALPREVADREKGLELASESDRATLLAARQREEAAAEAAISAAERQGSKWPPLIARSERSLTTISNNLPGEMQRLISINTSKLRQSIQLMENARASLAKKEFDAAETALRQATELWNENEIATRLQTELAAARTEADVAQEKAVAEAAATAAAAEATTEEAVAIEQAEKEKPFFLRPAGALTVVLVVLLLIVAYSVYKKLRNRENDVLE